MQKAVPNNVKIANGPKGSPLVGVMFEFPRDRRGFLTRVAQQYGNVAKFSIANLNFYEVVHPHGVQHILQDNAVNYERGAMFDPIRNLIGNGLLLSDGDFWQKQRALMEPGYHMKQIVQYGETITREASALADRWQTYAAQKRSFNALAELFSSTMTMTTRAVLSPQRELDVLAVNQAMESLLENISFRFETPFYPSLGFPTSRNRKLKQELQTFQQILATQVENRRRQAKAGGGFGTDLLGMFLAARTPDGQGMSDVELRAEITTVFATGPEPTSIAVAWAFYFLAGNPSVQEKLTNELAQTLQGRLPTVADLPKLPYTRMILQESMRLFPPAWLINRSAIQDDVVDDHLIPSGSVIMMSPYLTHRLPEFWSDPEKFDPERFSPEKSAGRPPFAYFPFGVGPHQCIGMDLAMLQAQLTLATLAQRFRLELAANAKIEVVSGLMLHPNQLPVQAIPLR